MRDAIRKVTMRHLVVAIFAVASIGLGQSPRLPQLLPVDAATEDESLRIARDAALAAAKTRNVDALMTLVSPTVFIGEGPNAPGATQRVLRESLADPKYQWWQGLEDALSHGGAFTTTRGAMAGQREFCAPYFYATFPMELPDAVQGERTPWVVIDKDVAVHAAPDAKSRVLARWSYVIVQANGGEQEDAKIPGVRWQSVDFPEDSESFVLANKIRNPEGYHVCFAKEWGKWRISAMIPHGGL